MKFNKKLVVIILFLVLKPLFAQEVSLQVKVDTSKILIGDHVGFELMVKSRPPTEIILPEIKDSLGKFEIIQVGKIDTQRTSSDLVLKRKFRLTIFDSGYYFVPSLTILYLRSGVNQYASIQSDSIPIFVKGIEIDTTKDIKDIKGIIEVPYTFWDYLPYLIIVIGIIFFGYLVFFIIKRRKKKGEVSEELKVPPHELALKELKKLDAEKLWQKGEVKLFHIRLTEIIRKYIERRFAINALEMISSEIIDSLGKIGEIEIGLLQKLQRSFQISDLVKFAKYLPLPDENAYCMKVGFEFVEITTPKEAVQPKEEAK